MTDQDDLFHAEWSTDIGMADTLARFMYESLIGCPEYISHSEIQEGRAVSPTTWSPDLEKILRASIENYLCGRNDDGGEGALAIATTGAKLVGLLQVSLENAPDHTYAVLEDLAIAPDCRNQRFGYRFLTWLHAGLRDRGVKYVFLESGLANAGAHHFFARNGYSVISKVMGFNL
jgi:ribosomal protein S18 acetylase RimI-like enzyme